MLNLRGLGLNETFVAGMEDALRPRISPDAEVLQARRFRADLNAAIARIREMGYTLEDATKIAQLTEFIPGPSDLVRMAVREAWRDDVAARWGYDADMPPHFAEQMQRLGDTENWARLYWRAHWELPSVTLGTAQDLGHPCGMATADHPDRVSPLYAGRHPAHVPGWRARRDRGLSNVPRPRLRPRARARDDGIHDPRCGRGGAHRVERRHHARLPARAAGPRHREGDADRHGLRSAGC